MEKLTSILVVLDGSSRDVSLLVKAARLATAFGARVELFSCDWMQAEALKRVGDAETAQALRAASIREQCAYLTRRAQNVGMRNVAVAVDAACETPLYEAIVRKAFGSRPDLVMKRMTEPSRTAHGALAPNDLQLVRTCPAPLLLCRDNPWPVWPRFGASVDLSDADLAPLAALTIRTARFLRNGCGGELELLFGEPARSVVPGRGDADPGVFQRDCDIIVLGALTRRTSATRMAGALTRRLMESACSDVVLVKPSSALAPSKTRSVQVLSIPTRRIGSGQIGAEEGAGCRARTEGAT